MGALNAFASFTWSLTPHLAFCQRFFVLLDEACMVEDTSARAKPSSVMECVRRPTFQQYHGKVSDIFAGERRSVNHALWHGLLPQTCDDALPRLSQGRLGPRTINLPEGQGLW